MKKTIFTLMLLLLTLLAMPIFAGGCEPPDVCPGPYGAEVEGNALTDAFKKVGDDNTGALGEIYGGAKYNAKGTEEAKGSADSTGHINAETTKTETAFISSSTSTLHNNATAEGITGPSVVSEEGFSRQATWGGVGDQHNYAFGSEETKAEESGSKNVSTGPVIITGNTSADGKTEGTLTSGDNFRRSDISNFGNSTADGSNSNYNAVSGSGEIGAGSYLEKGTSAGYADLYGTWCYDGNGSGEGAGTGYTRTEITETGGTLDVKSHSEAHTSATTHKFD
jgi:hypothetical protein